MCPEANLKSHQCDALVILTNMILISAVFLERRKIASSFQELSGFTGKGLSPFPSIAVSPSVWLSPRPTPNPLIPMFIHSLPLPCAAARTLGCPASPGSA